MPEPEPQLSLYAKIVDSIIADSPNQKVTLKKDSKGNPYAEVSTIKDSTETKVFIRSSKEGDAVTIETDLMKSGLMVDLDKIKESLKDAGVKLKKEKVTKPKEIKGPREVPGVKEVN